MSIWDDEDPGVLPGARHDPCPVLPSGAAEVTDAARRVLGLPPDGAGPRVIDGQPAPDVSGLASELGLA